MTTPSTNPNSEPSFIIGKFRFTPSRNELASDEQTTVLEPRLVALLKLLCEADGRTISRDEIMDRVWVGVVVSDLSITRAISDLRRFLEDNVKSPKVIGTVRKVGYRLLLKVQKVDALEHRIALPAQATQTTFFWIMPCLAVIFLAFYLWPQPIEARSWELMPVAVSSANETASSIASGGDRVAYVKNGEGDDQLWVWHADDASKELIYTSPLPIAETVWSDQDQSLIFCTWQPEALEIYKIYPKPGAMPTKFAQLPFTMLLGISPLDEDHLLISLARDQSEFVIYRINLSSGEYGVFLEPEEGILGYAYPKVSDNGSRVLVCRVEDLNTRRIAICDKNGKNLEVLEGQHHLYDLDWIDEETIGLISLDSYKPLMYLKDLDSNQEEVVDVGSHPLSIEFADHFVIDNTNLDIDVVSFHKEKGLQRLTRSVLTEMDAFMSRQSGRLTYISNENNRFQIAYRDPGGETKMVPHQSQRLGSPRWNHAEDQLVFIDHSDEGDRILIFDPETEQLKERFSHPSIGSLSGFSKNDQLLYCRVNDASFKGVLALKANGEIAARYKHAWKVVEQDGTLYFNRLDDAHLWKINSEGQPETAISLSHYIGSSWDIFEDRLFLIDRMSKFMTFDLTNGELLSSHQLDYTVYSIGNLTTIDGETFCFDFPKQSHGDVYYGRLK